MPTSPRKTEAYGLSLAPSSRLREEGKGMKDAGERTNVDPPLSGPLLKSRPRLRSLAPPAEDVSSLRA